MSANPYAAYRNASQTVAKTRQVVMLYDGMIRNLKQAAEAMEQQDFEARYNKLKRASEISIGLQMSLDFDSGGKTAQTLYDFYAHIDSTIMRLQRTNDLSACIQLVEEVRQMREVWDQIDQGAGDINNAQAANQES